MNTKNPSKTREKVITLKNKGYTVTDIAVKLKISKAAVSKHISKQIGSQKVNSNTADIASKKAEKVNTDDTKVNKIVKKVNKTKKGVNKATQLSQYEVTRDYLKNEVEKELEARFKELGRLKPKLEAYKVTKPLENALAQIESDKLRRKSKKALEKLLDDHLSGVKVLEARALASVTSSLTGIATAEDKRDIAMNPIQATTTPIHHLYCDANNMPVPDIDLKAEWRALEE